MDIPKPIHYFVELHGTRKGWPDNMTEAEEQVMNEHCLYLKELTLKGKVLMAGPVSGKFGMIVLSVYSKDEARTIMQAEPSVKAGVHTYTMTEMTTSLVANCTPTFRYAENVTDKAIRKEVIVSGTLPEVWHAWTTTEGVSTFFSPTAKVELRQGGPFEIYFLNDNPYGMRGSEDCKILSYLPERMLCIEWNGPPQFGKLRYKKTQVNIFFTEIDPGKVKVEFIQHGWGNGENWDKLYDYFDKAWEYVLGNLVKRFESGPLNWDAE